MNSGATEMRLDVGLMLCLCIPIMLSAGACWAGGMEMIGLHGGETNSLTWKMELGDAGWDSRLGATREGAFDASSTITVLISPVMLLHSAFYSGFGVNVRSDVRGAVGPRIPLGFQHLFEWRKNYFQVYIEYFASLFPTGEFRHGPGLGLRWGGRI